MQFRRCIDDLLMSKGMICICVLLLSIFYGCSNDIVEEKKFSEKKNIKVHLTIEGTRGAIAQENKNAAVTKAFRYNFDGKEMIPKLKLREGETVHSYCFIRNENKDIPVKCVSVDWVARGSMLQCDKFVIDIEYPQDQKVGKWEVCFYLGNGIFYDKTSSFTFDAGKEVRPISRDEEQQWQLPYLSEWTSLEVGKDMKLRVSSVTFRFQGAFFCTRMKNNTGQVVTIDALRMSATDPSQQSAPFVWQAKWNVASRDKESNMPLPILGKEDFVCKLPNPIVLKPGETSGWYGFWAMPIGIKNGYSMNIYVETSDKEVEVNVPWWVYHTPLEGKSNSQGPIAGQSYTVSFNLRKLVSTSLTNWMQDIDGNRLVAKMSIPGTHDTAANTGNLWVKTQDMDIKTQLKNGIRFFDIRLMHDNGTLKLCHGSYVFNTTFVKDVLQTTVDFLKEHPSETVVMTIKRDHDKDEDHGVKYYTALYKALNDDESISSYMVGDFQPDFKMKDLRGKMLIISREGWYPTKSGRVNSWPDNQSFSSKIISNNTKEATLTVEDHYKSSASKKVTYVRNNLLKANEAFDKSDENPEWFITFSSYAGPNGGASPFYTTGYVDPHVKKILEGSDNFQTSGILLFNFAGWYENGLTKTIIKLNKGVDLQTH